MTGIAEGIDTRVYAATQSNTRYAPFNSVTQEPSERAHDRAPLGGLIVLVALLLLSGITVALARGYSSSIENYGGSPEGLVSLAWLVEGAVAFLCFIFAVRWLRS